MTPMNRHVFLPQKKTYCYQIFCPSIFFHYCSMNVFLHTLSSPRNNDNFSIEITGHFSVWLLLVWSLGDRNCKKLITCFIGLNGWTTLRYGDSDHMYLIYWMMMCSCIWNKHVDDRWHFEFNCSWFVFVKPICVWNSYHLNKMNVQSIELTDVQ